MSTGYVFEEKYLWHNAGLLDDEWVEPVRHFEHPDTKRRFHNLLVASGLYNKLSHVPARLATRKEIELCHTPSYVDRIVDLSSRHGIHTVGVDCTMSKGGHEIALLAAGGPLALIDRVFDGSIKNAYCLIRPPGHHAEPDNGNGYCIYNNIAVAARYCQEKYGARRVAIVDFDVHHGNGTQKIFYNDNEVLFISLHQDRNYPKTTGFLKEVGEGSGKGYNINVPLPPGTGTGGYKGAFYDVVGPAVAHFKPDILLVSCGLDCTYMDPLGHMMLGASDMVWITSFLMELAAKLCKDRLIYFHEGGYSDFYVPFCGLAILETLSGIKTLVTDPMEEEHRTLGYHEEQLHQRAVIEEARKVYPFN